MKKSLVLLGLALVALVAGLLLANTMANRITDRGLQADAQGTSGRIPDNELALLGGGVLLVVIAFALAIIALVVLLRSRLTAPATDGADAGPAATD